MILAINTEKNSDSLLDNLVWMTSAEAAKYLRKSVGALRVAVCRGQISCYKWRRRLYFRRSAIEKMLSDSQQIGGL